MPGFDRSGPMGQGSQSGRSMGKCNPDAQSSDQYNDFSRGMGCRRGFGGGIGGAGRGRGRGVNFSGQPAGNRQPIVPVDEHDTLRTQANQLKESLASIQQRLDALEKKE